MESAASQIQLAITRRSTEAPFHSQISNSQLRRLTLQRGAQWAHLTLAWQRTRNSLISKDALHTSLSASCRIGSVARWPIAAIVARKRTAGYRVGGRGVAREAPDSALAVIRPTVQLLKAILALCLEPSRSNSSFLSQHRFHEVATKLSTSAVPLLITNLQSPSTDPLNSNSKNRIKTLEDYP